MKHAILAVMCILLFAGSLLADWNPNDPFKWVQPPDRSPAGMDVKVGPSVPPGPNAITKVLADDFECTQKTRITDIHIWGSWRDDFLPVPEPDATGTNMPPDPGNAKFTLGIWSDIPAVPGPIGGPPEVHSQPGQLLWSQSFDPHTYQVREAFQGPEDWYDPNTGEWHNDNHLMAYQYNFLIDPARAFEQEGTANAPVIYWLSVGVEVVDIEQIAQFGWKTSDQHWNDDAVWRDEFDTAPGPWNELRYPDGHEFQGESLDLAFVITPEPTTMMLLALGGLAVIWRRRK